MYWKIHPFIDAVVDKLFKVFFKVKFEHLSM